MRLYSLLGTERVQDGDQEFLAGEDGGFDVPDDLGAYLHATHIAGAKAWETDGERSTRLVMEEEERRRDPATLLAAVEALVRAQSTPAETPTKAPAKKRA